MRAPAPTCRRLLPLALALAVALGGRTARGAEPAPELDASAAGLGPIDLATLEVSIGTASGLDAHRPDIEGRLGLTLLHAELTGVALDLIGLEVLARSGRDRISGTLEIYNVEHWFVGTSEEGEACLALPGMKTCDPASGYWGFSIRFPALEVDDQPARWAARFFEASLLVSPAAGYDPGWRQRHVLLSAGLGIDHLWARRDEESETLIRPFVGLDAALRWGPVDLAPSFRWRVATRTFPDDFGVEALLRISHRGLWHGRGQAGDACTMAMTIGYAHWSEPAHAFGADWSTGARDTLFARVAVAPSFFSLLPL